MNPIYEGLNRPTGRKVVIYHKKAKTNEICVARQVCNHNNYLGYHQYFTIFCIEIRPYFGLPILHRKLYDFTNKWYVAVSKFCFLFIFGIIRAAKILSVQKPSFSFISELLRVTHFPSSTMITHCQQNVFFLVVGRIFLGFSSFSGFQHIARQFRRYGVLRFRMLACQFSYWSTKCVFRFSYQYLGYCSVQQVHTSNTLLTFRNCLF